MDVEEIAHVGNHGHADVFEFRRRGPLGIAKFGIVHAIGIAIMVRGQLHEEER